MGRQNDRETQILAIPVSCSVAFCEVLLVPKFEQRANMKFCFKLGKTATETYNMLQKVYVETAVANKTIFK